jgi:hypothetical protein
MDGPEAGVLKKLSLAGLAELSRLRYSPKLAGVHSTADYLTAVSAEHEIPGVGPLSLAERG